MEKMIDLNDVIRVSWNLRKVSNVFPKWYTEINGTMIDDITADGKIPVIPMGGMIGRTGE